MKLEELQPKTTVRGILPDGPITVVSPQWYGADALELTYKTLDGRVGSQLLARHDEPRLELVEAGRPWSFDGDGAVPSIYSSVRAELDRSPVSRDHACMISSFVRARPWHGRKHRH